MRKSSGPHATSAGHAQSSSLWLDVRYETNRTAYEAQVHAVGLQPGWRVLDAGCGGGGAFLPLLVTVVGPHGRVEALDLAPENIAVVNERVVRSGLGAQVTAQIGSVLALPYPSGSFDAVWCANTTQYLSDAELAVALGELRPGRACGGAGGDQGQRRDAESSPNRPDGALAPPLPSLGRHWSGAADRHPADRDAADVVAAARLGGDLPPHHAP